MATAISRSVTRRRLLIRAALVPGAALALTACSVPANHLLSSLQRIRHDHGATTTAAAASGTATMASTTASASATPPGPTATPENVPGAIAAAFLARWVGGDYAAMYELISADAQQKISKDDFVQRYYAIRLQATITKIIAALDPGQRPSSNIQHFTVTFETVLVGTITEQNTITLNVDQGGQDWKVQWLPSLIFKELTGDNIIRMFPVDTPRGDIRDRSGNALATAGKVARVYLIPGEIKDEQAMLTQVGQLLGMPQAVIKLKYAQSPVDSPVDLKLLAQAKAAPIRATLTAIPGVHVVDETARVYPRGGLASQTLGYMSPATSADLQKLAIEGYRQGDVIGRAGIEQWAQEQLAGRRGGKLMVTTRKIDPVTTIAERAPIAASTVYLTIDVGLQQRCEELLGKRAGSIGVMRVQDGSLLALASAPGFDPNQFILGITEAAYQQLVNDPLQPLLNRLVNATYPTGTVFAPVTVAAALDQAGYNASSTFDCPGHFTVGATTWSCWKRDGHGQLDLTSALAQSCDVALYTMAQREDGSKQTLLPDEAAKFGLGQDCHLRGLDCATGVLPSPTWKQKALREGWVVGDAINLSVGQGSLLASPLQVLNFYAALANGGTLWTPRIVEKSVGPDDTVTDANPPMALAQLPISEPTLQALRQGLHRVTADPDGRAASAFQGFATPVAGMAGTAQAPSGTAHAWFAGYAPVDQPQVSVVAAIEHSGEGIAVAAPIVRSVLEAYFGAQRAAGH